MRTKHYSFHAHVLVHLHLNPGRTCVFIGAMSASCSRQTNKIRPQGMHMHLLPQTSIGVLELNKGFLNPRWSRSDALINIAGSSSFF